MTITPRLESASGLYRPSDRRLSAKLVPTFADNTARTKLRNKGAFLQFVWSHVISRKRLVRFRLNFVFTCVSYFTAVTG
jgi:hypothetical protein